MGKRNIFADQATRRNKEQTELEAVVTAVPSEVPKHPVMVQPRQDADARTTMCVALSAAEKKMLKQYAVAQGKTTSSIIQGWIREFCGSHDTSIQ